MNFELHYKLNKFFFKILILFFSIFSLSSIGAEFEISEINLVSDLDCTVDDSNINSAVNLWVSDQATAEATYGHISTWDTSCVTDMSELFKNLTNFYFNFFPMKVELLTWKNTLKHNKIKHILKIPYFLLKSIYLIGLNIPYFFLKRIIFINKFFIKYKYLPYSLG